MQCCNTDGNSLRILGEQSDQSSGDQPAQCRADSHDPGSQFQRQPVDLLHTLPLSGTVIVTNQRPDALNDAIGGQIDKGLQLVINAQYQHIRTRISRQNTVQCGNQQRRQCHIQRSRNADAVGLATDLSFRSQISSAQFYRQRIQHVIDDIY